MMNAWDGAAGSEGIRKAPEPFSGSGAVRPTGLEPVPIAGHAPQTCAYADSATAAYHGQRQQSYHGKVILSRLSLQIVKDVEEKDAPGTGGEEEQESIRRGNCTRCCGK